MSEDSVSWPLMKRNNNENNIELLFPAVGYLLLAWKMLAKCKGQFYDKTPVLLENVTLHRATILSKTSSAMFGLMTTYFEVWTESLSWRYGDHGLHSYNDQYRLLSY